MGRLTAAIAAVACVASLSAQPTPPLAKELRRTLDARLARAVEGLDGAIGYAAVDLTGGEEFGRLERETFPTASTIKVAILYELFRQADEKALPLDENAPLARSAVVGGSGVLKALSSPALSLRDHAVLMMALSDNTSTNLLIDRLTFPAIAARMESLGLPGIRLRRKMMDAAAAARGDENVSTPRELAAMLRILHAGTGLSKTSHDAAMRVLAVNTGGYIRRAVPPGTEVLSKGGELEGVRADIAIVRAGRRPYALAVMTTYLKDEGDGERAIGEVSRAFYEYFSRLSAGSEFGRQVNRTP